MFVLKILGLLILLRIVSIVYLRGHSTMKYSPLQGRSIRRYHWTKGNLVAFLVLAGSFLWVAYQVISWVQAHLVFVGVLTLVVLVVCWAWHDFKRDNPEVFGLERQTH